MSQEKTKHEEAQKFMIEQVNAGEYDFAKMLVLYANRENEEALEEIEDLKKEIEELRIEIDGLEEDVDIANSQAAAAENDYIEIESKLEELEDFSPKTLEEDLKISIAGRMINNCNLTELEHFELLAKQSLKDRGAQYQDYGQ